MGDRLAAERACKDPNPIVDGRKANVNLAYLGAKPRLLQSGVQSPPDIICRYIYMEYKFMLWHLLELRRLSWPSILLALTCMQY